MEYRIQNLFSEVLCSYVCGFRWHVVEIIPITNISPCQRLRFHDLLGCQSLRGEREADQRGCEQRVAERSVHGRIVRRSRTGRQARSVRSAAVAADEVVVDETCGLHVRVDDRRADDGHDRAGVFEAVR